MPDAISRPHRNEARPLPFTPVIIIGAGRSGTNALRDALTALPGLETWPCDEINPIWRHGNLRHPDDELPQSAARPEVRRFIRRAFLRIWQQRGRPPFVVEKTCANALRVPFVDAVLSHAKFIHIVRDGVDVVASARKRWRGELDVPGLPYFMAKARYAPLSDLPVYAASAIGRRVAVRLGRRVHMGAWGPRFAGIERHAGAPVEELCARQWVACVERADAAFAAMAEDRVISVYYEAMTADPADTLGRITEFLGHDVPAEALATAAGTIRSGGAGNERRAIGDLEQIIPILKGPLGRHGYL